MLTLSVGPAAADQRWFLLGSLSGTSNPPAQLAFSGLHLTADRYMLSLLNGASPLVQGGLEGFSGGLVVPFDLQGQATLQVQVTVALTFAP